ncbi:MAG: SH3 domain-containing protein [Candidatus Electrothrix scaldis]|nr:MAG: SH3 domain-containing protein [Candidatus Electrothrix sp. GW3-3]
MHPRHYLSFCLMFLLVSSFISSAANAAPRPEIGEIKINGDGYVLMTENPNADSQPVGWIPEGDFVQILAGPFAGTIDRIPTEWHQVEYRKQTGFVLSHLLNFYRFSSRSEPKDIAKIRINGNGYINIRASSSIDSPQIGCIPEGKIIKLQSDPIEGYVGDRKGSWYKVDDQGTIGYIWEDLLDFYSLFPQDEPEDSEKKDDGKTDDRKIAEMVMEMIRNGQEIVFSYRDGKLLLSPTQPALPYPVNDGY